MNPLSTRLEKQEVQVKQELCQCLPSNETNLVPPVPTGSEHVEQGLEKSCVTQCVQYCLSSRVVKLRPARDWLQWVQVKHCLCQG